MGAASLTWLHEGISESSCKQYLPGCVLSGLFQACWVTQIRGHLVLITALLDLVR
jgi:hypothetical protein